MENLERPRRPINKEARRKAKNRRTAKLIIGIVSIVLFVIIELQACAIGTIGVFVEEQNNGSLQGMAVGFLMLIAGIVAIATRKRRPGGIVAGVMYALAAIFGYSAPNIYGDLTIWSFLALAFAIVFLWMSIASLKHKDFWRHWWFYLLAVLILLGLIFMLFSGSKEEPAEEESPGVTAEGEAEEAPGAMQPGEATSAQSVAQGVTADSVETERIYVKYLSHNIYTDSDGEECLRVVYEFTNKSDVDTSFSIAVADRAFQNGIQNDSAFVWLDDDEKNEGIIEYGTMIRPGTTITTERYYELTDKSPVTLEVEESFSFDDITLLMELALE